MKRVLCLDDDPAILELEEMLLKQAEFEVLAAKNATEAMEKTEGVLLDLIILDLNLAGEDGTVMMNFMLRNHPGVPIILYTGENHTDAEAAKLLEQGASEYVRKQTGTELVAAAKRLCPPK